MQLSSERNAKFQLSIAYICRVYGNVIVAIAKLKNLHFWGWTSETELRSSASENQLNMSAPLVNLDRANVTFSGDMTWRHQYKVSPSIKNRWRAYRNFHFKIWI